MKTNRSHRMLMPLFTCIGLVVLLLGCVNGPWSTRDPDAITPGVETVLKGFDYSTEYGTDEYDGGVIFYGDTRKHHDVHMDMVERVLAFDPGYVFHLGDMVSDGDQQIQWNDFDEITRNLRQVTDLYPVIGNHEKGVDPPWYAGHWDHPIGQGYYSLDMLSSGEIVPVPIGLDGQSDYAAVPEDAVAHLAVLHSNPGFLEPDSAQHEWLLNDLDHYDSIPTILVFHIPLYCAGVHHDEMEEAHPAAVLYDIIEDEDIVACVSGHDHAYQRFDVDGFTQVVSGCAGESPYDIEQPDHPYLEVYEPVYHLTVMKLEDGELTGEYRLRFTAFDIDYTIIDTFVIDL